MGKSAILKLRLQGKRLQFKGKAKEPRFIVTEILSNRTQRIKLQKD